MMWKKRHREQEMLKKKTYCANTSRATQNELKRKQNCNCTKGFFFCIRKLISQRDKCQQKTATY